MSIADPAARAIRRLEELSLNAWPAFRSVFLDGWLLTWADGMSRRNNACHPLYPGTQPVEEKIAAVEAFFRGFARPAIFKIHDAVEPPGLAGRLVAAGYHAGDTTLVETLDCPVLPPDIADPACPCRIVFEPDPEWLSLYGACLGVPATTLPLSARMLEAVAVEKRFFTLLERDRPVACGYGAREGAWFGLYGIGVLPGLRGRGFGRQVTRCMLGWAANAGARQAYLQVMENNPVARTLYARLGFREHYRYRYYTRPGTGSAPGSPT